MALMKKSSIIILIILSLASVLLFYSPVSASNFAIWNVLNSGTTKDLYGLWGTNNNDVFIVGQSGTIRYYDGSAWSSQDSNTTNNLRGIWGIDNSDVFAVGDSGTILHYDGSTWSLLNSGTTQNLNSVWGTINGAVFAVGQAGTILHYDGNVWSSQSSGITEDLNCIWGIDDRDIFAAGNSGTILHYNGYSWASLNSHTSSDLMGIWGVGSNDIFAVGDSGTVLRYDGDIWVSQNSFTPSNLHCIWGTDVNHIFIIGESGTLSYFDGLEFSSMNRNTSDQLYSVWGSSSIDVFTVGRSGIVLRYSPPVITSISPGLGNQGETLDITINGGNLSRTSEVKFGTGIAVNSFSALDSTRITVNITIVSSASVGTRDVSVITPGGSFTLPASFKVQQSLPAISSVSPAGGRQNTTLNVNLTGINLSGITKVQFGAGISVNNFTILSSNQVTVNITILADADSGSRDISVTTSGGSFTLPEGFTVQPALPNISSINPDQGNRESTFAVIINGSHLSGATEVIFGTGVTVNNFTILSSNQISASISVASNASIGTRDVSVTTPGGSFTLPDGFILKQALPSIASLSPSQGSLGATLQVTITGANLTGTTEIRLATGIVVNSFTIINAQQVKAEITILSGLETGARDVSITTPGGSFTLFGGFTVSPAPPVITSLNLNQGHQGSALTVIINGSNLDKTSSVSFGSGVIVQQFTNLSPTQLSVNIMIDEDAVTGLRDVSVTTPGGTSSLSNGFTIQEKSTATLFIALLWVVIALAIALFVLLLNLLRKKRVPKA